MLLEFKLPLITAHMSDSRVECVFAAAGDRLKAGSKLFDLQVDLGSGFSQDCPPISYFRIIVREAVQVREITPKPGDVCKVGDVLALFTTGPEPVAGEAVQRGIRHASAGIMHHAGMWTGSSR